MGDQDLHGRDTHARQPGKDLNAEQRHDEHKDNEPKLDFLAIAGEAVIAGSAGGLASKLLLEAKGAKAIEGALKEISEEITSKHLEKVPLADALKQLTPEQQRIAKQCISEFCQAISTVGLPIKETLVEPNPNRSREIYDRVMHTTLEDAAKQMGTLAIALAAGPTVLRLLAANMQMGDKK